MALQSPRSAKLGPPSSARSGSVFIITSDGKVLSLPIPSESRYDPLNWNSRKRALALVAVGVYSWIGLTLPQDAGLTMKGLEREFALTVSGAFRLLFLSHFVLRCPNLMRI